MSDKTLPAGTAPLEYTVRVSARTRRVTLRVEPGRGLVVSAPRRLGRRALAELVEANREWAEAALAELHRRTPAVCLAWPPERLELAAVGRPVRLCWTDAAGVATAAAARASPARWRDPFTLELALAPDERVAVATAIGEALRLEARRTLVPRLQALAERHALPVRRIAVRGQRSVWGSCSSSGTLSLNYKLLFLPPELVDYVLLHELVHTRHLDHSREFWRCLGALEPRAKRLDARLRDAATLVPPWLELAGAVAESVGVLSPGRPRGARGGSPEDPSGR